MKVLTGVLGILLFAGATWAGNFTDNQNGTVTDNVTGLVWQQQDDGTQPIWYHAIDYCEGLTLASLTDWRLPNVKELESITDDSRNLPAIDITAFPNTKDYYWSSSSYPYAMSVAMGYDAAYAVDFTYGGYVGYSDTWSFHYVRCVRGGQ